MFSSDFKAKLHAFKMILLSNEWVLVSTKANISSVGNRTSRYFWQFVSDSIESMKPAAPTPIKSDSLLAKSK